MSASNSDRPVKLVPDEPDYGFDRPLDRSRLSTWKWEGDIARKGDPDLLCLGIAEMDFPAAPPIVHAMQRLIDTGHFGYPYKQQPYYDALVGYLARRFDWQVEQSWIAHNVGIYPSMHALIEQLSEPGDEIIFQSPVHHIFPEIISAGMRVPVANPLRETAGRYEMDFEDLAAKIGPRTRMLFLCNPHNPVGRAWSCAELSRLNEICVARGVIVVSDEVYASLVFPGATFTPFAKVSAEAAQNSVTLMSASKSFNLTGLKHSIVIAPNPHLLDRYMRGMRSTNLYFGGSIFGQAATEAAFRHCDTWTDALMAYIGANVDLVRQFIATRMPGVRMSEPEATYFAWLDFRQLGLEPDALQSFFEDQAHVALTMGEPMGPGGAGFARLNLATQRSVIEQALHRIADAYQRLNSRSR